MSTRRDISVLCCIAEGKCEKIMGVLGANHEDNVEMYDEIRAISDEIIEKMAEINKIARGEAFMLSAKAEE